ncbi:Cold shock protein CspA [Candidatus Nasuia deltocephalinicola]|uniref:Cold shock protein CspA n=1 Tax=Candidatus Nasuia deltocephalincola TaxID=1160784 RepID=A0A0S2UP46_9PROT|nr:Cold shock protein CspA [Candidatus Nasuia deltocephalinicola]
MLKGIVKWFNDAKGYGFIIGENGDEDLFVHFSAILMQGFKTLREGQKVIYKKLKTLKGIQAVDVEIYGGD